MNKEQSLKILDRFCNKEITTWLGSFFNIGDKSCASNSYVLIMFPKIEDYPDHSDKCKFLNDPFNEVSIIFSVKEIKNKLESLDKINDFEEIKCKACDGYGTVEFEFYYDLETYGEELECPLCEGEGSKKERIKDQKIIDPKYCFKLHDKTFLIERIEELLFICDTLNTDEITLKKVNSKSSVFQIGEAEVLVMGMYTKQLQQYEVIEL